MAPAMRAQDAHRARCTRGDRPVIQHTLAWSTVPEEQSRSNVWDLIDAVADPGSFRRWDADPPRPDDDPDYLATLNRAAQRSGVDESIVTGAAEVDGREVALVAGDFGFLAGSVGMAAADRFIAAMRRATKAGLPVLACPTSGGTRMQEGTPAFLRMVPVAAAVADHRAAGLPYLVWLRDPTTGGVMATWGSLGQVTAAAPGALAGFLGPRVFEAMTGEVFPPQVQRAENLARVGVIDAVVALPDLRAWVSTALTIIAARGPVDPAAELLAGELPPQPDAWAAVQATRRADRPGVRDLLSVVADAVLPLSGTGAGERDDAVLVALARIGGIGTVVVGQDRSAVTAMGPAGLRTARRGYALAAELGLPLLTVVDTEGAEVSPAAEERAMAGEIARSLADLARLPTGIVALLLGSGCGGGALAMLPSDLLYAADDAWITPLPPEGASAILHRSTDRAPELAREQRITAVELARLGVVDACFGVPSAEAFTAAASWLGAALAGVTPNPRRVSRFEVARP